MTGNVAYTIYATGQRNEARLTAEAAQAASAAEGLAQEKDS